MANSTSAAKGKRQVAALSKRQLGVAIGQNILGQLSNVAAGIAEIVDKGNDPGTRQPLRCSPEDIRRYWTPEQSAAIDEFIANFAVEPEPAPAPPAVAKPAAKRKK